MHPRTCRDPANTHRVLLVDTEDRIVAQWGEPEVGLSDPHHAVLLGETVLIADSGNDRLIELDVAGRIHWQLEAVKGPRHVDPQPDGTLVVTDTDDNRIICIDRSGRTLWSVGLSVDVSRYRAAAPQIRMPRSAVLYRGSRLLVADYDNSRVVALTPSTRKLGDS